MIYDFEAATEREAIEKASAELGLEQDRFDVEIIETQKGTIFKKGYVKIRVHTEGDESEKPVTESTEASNTPPSPAVTRRESAALVPQDEFEQKIIEFISTVITKMGYKVQAEIMFREERKIGVKLTSPDSSVLIGRKGKNIDALQLLTNSYAAKLGREDTRVILDTENYRVRREETLVRLAYTTADRVRTSGGSVLLEPMNPFERRLIHTTLNDVADVETKSEGEGQYKRVRVIHRSRRG